MAAVDRVLFNPWVQRASAVSFLLAGLQFAIGAPVNFLTYALLTLGVVLLVGPPVRSITFWRGKDGKLRAALHGMREELGTVERRITETQKRGHFAWDFFLPGAEWAQHRDTLSDNGLDYERSLAYEAYERVGALNEEAQARENNGSEVLDEDDLPGALHAVKVARAVLGRRLFGSGRP